MSKSHQYESRRHERRRRERLRKKRIRLAVILIALIGLIVLICVAVQTFKKDDGSQQAQPDDTSIETTLNPDDTTIPTVAPVIAQTSNIPPASEEINLLQIIADAGQTKHCYLTFDDGPTKNITPQILDTLRRYNAKATFFQVGSLIDANPDMARRVYEEGHLIANHSHGHNYEKLYASTEAFMTEITKCENSIKSVMDGEEPFRLMRFPGGSYNAGDHASMKQNCKEVLRQNNYYYIDWNCLNGDSEGKTKNASQLLDYLKQTSQGYNNLIVLMHDAAAKQATADALGSIIEYLASQGYTFHRLDDIDYQTATATSGTSGTSDTSGTSGTSGTSDTSGTAATNAPAASTQAPSETVRPTPIPASTGAIIIQ